jgi:hypothetical protein
MSNVGKINIVNKENSPPAASLQDTVPAADFYAVQGELDQEWTRAQDYEQCFCNSWRQVLHAQSSLVFCTGNPRVFLAVPVPVPVKTRTCQAGTRFCRGCARKKLCTLSSI